MTWAILPVKDLATAKQRLNDALTPGERRDLFQAMVEDVLEALSRVRGLAGICVFTRDSEAVALAKRYGARLVMEGESLGQTAAVTAAASVLAVDGVADVVCVPGDVPLATAVEIERVLAHHRAAPDTRPRVTIVPARDRLGSNCLVCSPPDALPFRFGDNSFARHLAAARRAGVVVRSVEAAGLGLDVDTPDDLAVLLRRAGETRAQAYLKASGIAARLLVATGPGRGAGRPEAS